MNIHVRPGSEILHIFRTKILGLSSFNDRLYAATERGVYRLDKNGKRWRKVLPSMCQEKR